MKTDTAKPETVVRLLRVDGDREQTFFQLHLESGGDVIVPLPQEEFSRLVADGCVFGAVDGDGRAVALTYMQQQSTHASGAAWERGGLFVAEQARGLGLASALCVLAIAGSVFDLSQSVTALVQQANAPSLRLLARVGFADTGRRLTVPADRYVGYLQRDASGAATARVLELGPAGYRLIAAALDAGVGAQFASPGELEAMVGGPVGAVANRLRG